MWKILVAILKPVLSFAVDLCLQVLQWFWSGLMLMAVAAWSQIVALLPESWVAYLHQTPWEPLLPYFDGLQYVVPVKEVFAIWVVALGICGAIRLVRWIMAAVPGISIFGNSIGPFGGA